MNDDSEGREAGRPEHGPIQRPQPTLSRSGFELLFALKQRRDARMMLEFDCSHGSARDSDKISTIVDGIADSALPFKSLLSHNALRNTTRGSCMSLIGAMDDAQTRNGSAHETSRS